MSQDLAQEARAEARVGNIRKTAVIASDREAGHQARLRRRERAGIVLRAAALDHLGEKGDIPGAGLDLLALIDLGDR